MNLFHANNHRYQSLLSAGVKASLCFAPSLLARSRYRVAQSCLVRFQPGIHSRKIRADGVGQFDVARHRLETSQPPSEEAAGSRHSRARALRVLSKRCVQIDDVKGRVTEFGYLQLFGQRVLSPSHREELHSRRSALQIRFGQGFRVVLLCSVVKTSIQSTLRHHKSLPSDLHHAALL